MYEKDRKLMREIGSGYQNGRYSDKKLTEGIERSEAIVEELMLKINNSTLGENITEKELDELWDVLNEWENTKKWLIDMK